MELIFTVLTAAFGALSGTCAGVIMMRRNLRPPISNGELAELKERADKSAADLAASTVNLEQARKQLQQRDSVVQQTSEELQKKQQLLDLALADAQKEAAARGAAEQQMQELFIQAATLTEQCSSL